MSPLASAKAISSSVVMLAGRSWLRWTGPAASDQSPEPLVWTVDEDSDRAVNRIELNRIDSFVALTRIKSFSFLPNRPSLVFIQVLQKLDSLVMRHTQLHYGKKEEEKEQNKFCPTASEILTEKQHKDYWNGLVQLVMELTISLSLMQEEYQYYFHLKIHKTTSANIVIIYQRTHTQ